MNRIKWILFDFGNVISQYSHKSTHKIAEFYGVGDSAIRNIIYNGEMCRDDLMNGNISASDFIDYHFNNPVEDICNPSTFQYATRQMFVEWMKDEMTVIDGIPELLQYFHHYQRELQLGVLSNTWFAHWDYYLTTDLANYFDLNMASHELGGLKPDPEIYRLACSRMQCNPDEVVFFDDKVENVEGANKYGMKAYLVDHSKNLNKTREILKSLELYNDESDKCNRDT